MEKVHNNRIKPLCILIVRIIITFSRIDNADQNTCKQLTSLASTCIPGAWIRPTCVPFICVFSTHLSSSLRENLFCYFLPVHSSVCVIFYFYYLYTFGVFPT